MFGTKVEPQKPLLASVKDFGELFTSARRWTQEIGAKRKEIPLNDRRNWFLTGFISETGFPSLEAEPTGIVVEKVKENMVPVAWDRIYFEIIRRDDGTATVYARYNQIIGSRILAEIDAATIPRV